MWDESAYRLADERELASPSLIYYPDVIRRNTERAIELAGGPGRLWPHVKSHKLTELIAMQRALGIDRFKCATLAELRMTAGCGAAHALLAYPLVGPNIGLFLDTVSAYPDTHMYALADSLPALRALDAACAARGLRVDWLCDVNMGMDRTGVPTGELAAFCREAARLEHVKLVGLHCYDGHNHQHDADERARAVDGQMAAVERARAELCAQGVDTPVVIAGGSPSFACHARREGVFLSPGTVFLWDWGYASAYPELPFEPGAALLTRVVSHPAADTFTLDLGYKAIASDSAGERGVLLGCPHAHPLFQSEEHWTWRMEPGHERPEIGRELYVIPTHICPTTALHSAVRVARGGRTVGTWRVAARDRA